MEETSARKHHEALIAHLAMFGACAGWGLMAPVGKDAMTHGFDGLTMVTARVAGACLLFWLASLFVRREQVPLRDKLMFGGAAVFGLLLNQCCYTIGLSLTSPINASIVTTSMPIFAMLLSALILREPITGKKALGVLMGCSGALILILSSASSIKLPSFGGAGGGPSLNITEPPSFGGVGGGPSLNITEPPSFGGAGGGLTGDLLCLFAQFSFALYLSLFNSLIRRYSVFTINRYMFTWAALLLLPFTAGHVGEVLRNPIPAASWLEMGYVVTVGTFLCYILTMIGQRVLRPTVVSVYNYVQPIVSVAASLLMGVGVLSLSHGVAVVLVFSGVWLVTKSRRASTRM